MKPVLTSLSIALFNSSILALVTDRPASNEVTLRAIKPDSVSSRQLPLRYPGCPPYLVPSKGAGKDRKPLKTRAGPESGYPDCYAHYASSLPHKRSPFQDVGNNRKTLEARAESAQRPAITASNQELAGPMAIFSNFYRAFGIAQGTLNTRAELEKQPASGSPAPKAFTTDSTVDAAILNSLWGLAAPFLNCIGRDAVNRCEKEVGGSHSHRPLHY